MLLLTLTTNNLISIAVALIGVFGVIFNVWYTNFRTKKIEEVKTKHQKELHIYKLQFEKEYKIYLEIWNKVILVNNSLEMMRNANMNKDDQTFRSTFHNFYHACKKFQLALETNRPFYSIPVYAVLQSMVEFLQTEIKLIESCNHNYDEYFASSPNTEEDFEGLYISISDTISEVIQIDTYADDHQKKSLAESIYTKRFWFNLSNSVKENK